MGREDKEDHLQASVVEETDCFDVVDDNVQEIDIILEVDHNVQDKLTFTIFSMNIIVTSFLLGYAPNYYYIWHTIQALVLLPCRWLTYKKLKFHYFLFDFCYFTNYLTLAYIWIPSSIINVHYHGELFTLCYSSAMGPVLVTIIMWKNSLVPHSVDKMTSLYVHISSSLTLWGIRWFVLPDQSFPICADQTQPGPDGCQHVNFQHIVLNPLVLYLLWQVLYIAVVEVWRKDHIKERQYETSYKWMAEKATQGVLVQLFSIFGARHRKLMFIVWQFVYTTITVLIGYNCYHSRYFAIYLISFAMAVACYNGASFYINVFKQQHNIASPLKATSTSRTLQG